MKKIISLTNVFIKEYYQNLPIFDSKNRKFNKRSMFFWLIVIVFFGIIYVSYEIINFLKNLGQAEVFLNIYFPILAILLAFQTILACSNIFFFSKDIEKVLHMPIKPLELLISKFNTMLCMLYATEAIFTIMPILLYGLMANNSLLFFIWSIVILIAFPVFIALIISILMLIIMRFVKFIRNKDIFQIFITLMLVGIILFVEFKATQEFFYVENNNQALAQMVSISDRMQVINNTFLIINPTIYMLSEPSSLNAIASFFAIMGYSIIAFLLFITIGKITYLKDLLKSLTSANKKHKQLKTAEVKNKTKGIAKAYIEKEIKILIKEPAFFMQCIFPSLILLITAIIILISASPMIQQLMQNKEIKSELERFSFNTEIVCNILIILQVLFSISNISLTAISREGKNAVFIKYIPVELYKQFLYKIMPQFVLNLIITIIALGIVWHLAPSIAIINMLIIFAIATIINLINCYLMLVVDLRRPNLDWESAQAVIRKNDNKLFQYALLIINVLVLLYFANVLKNIELLNALIVELIIFSIIFIIIDRCIHKWQKKLFNKIY